MAIAELAPLYLGQDPRQVAAVFDSMYKGLFVKHNQAVAGIVLACWDILGKSLGVPVWQPLPGWMGATNAVVKNGECREGGMMGQNFYGIIAIPVTPFDRSYELDEPSLRRVIRFALDCGAHGLLTPVNASEWYTLSDAERQRVVEITLGEVSGAIPVIVGVTAQSVTAAIALARHARQHGATAISAMPPPIVHTDAEGCYAYYRALSSALDVPVVIQNYYAPLGTPMSPELIVRMVRELPHLAYVKEETLPEPLRISQLLAAAAGEARLRGVFGGQGGLFLLDELRRGAAGNMPATHAADALVAVWEAWRSGDDATAQALHNRLLPLLNFERCYGGTPVYKEVLRRRGVIRTPVFRFPAPPLDAAAQRELDRILADVGSLFRL